MKLVKPSFLYVVFFASLFVSMRTLGLGGDYIAGVTTAAVGYIAYLIYALGKISHLEDAAKILILDIRNAEHAVTNVRVNDTVASWSRVLWLDNSWLKYKHLLVSELNSDEFKAFDDFFYHWSGLVRAKMDAAEYKVQSLVAKSAAGSTKILELDRASPSFQEDHNIIKDRMNLDTWFFAPDDIVFRAKHFLEEINPLTGTTGFAKVRKLAGLKE